VDGGHVRCGNALAGGLRADRGAVGGGPGKRRGAITAQEGCGRDG
jgi:hypothetical protein